MPGHLGLLPWRQLRVGRPKLPISDRGQPRNLISDVDAIRLRHAPQLLDFAFQLGDRLFEVEVMAHGARALPQITGRGRSDPSLGGDPYHTVVIILSYGC